MGTGSSLLHGRGGEGGGSIQVVGGSVVGVHQGRVGEVEGGLLRELPLCDW